MSFENSKYNRFLRDPLTGGNLRTALCLATLGLLIIAIFFPVLFQGKTMLPSDMFNTMTLPYSQHYGPPQAYNHNLVDAVMQSYPWKKLEQDALRSGKLAYWNPLILNGYPQYAASRQAFDLFNVLLIFLSLPIAFNLIILLELWLSGIGMFFLLRCHGRSRFIGLMFATAWMFNGMFLTHLLNLWATAVFCWVPIAICFLYKYYQSGSFKQLLLSGLVVGIAFLGATLQVAAYVVIIVVVLSVYYSRATRSGSYIGRSFRTSLIVLAVGFMVSAIMWLPSIELFIRVLINGKLYSPSHEVVYTLVKRLLSFGLLAGFYMPELLGIVRSLGLTSIAGVHPLDFSGYFGFTAMILGTWGLFTWRSSSRESQGFTALLVLGLLLPLVTPLYTWLYHRFFIVATFGGVVVAAERFERLLNGEIEWNKFKRWYRVFVLFFALLVVLLIGLNLYFASNTAALTHLKQTLLRSTSGRPFSQGNELWEQSRINATIHQYTLTFPSMYVPLIVIGLNLIALRFIPKREVSRKAIVSALYLLAICQIIFWWRSWIPMLDVSEFPTYPESPAISFLQQHAYGSRVYFDRRDVDSEQYIFLDNEASMYGISESQGYESEMSRSFYPILRTEVNPTHPHPAFLGVIGVKYFVVGKSPIDSTDLRRVFSTDLNIFENDLFQPRVRILHRAVSMGDSAVVRTMLVTRLADSVLLLSDEEPIDIKDSGLKQSVPQRDSAIITKSESNLVEISANSGTVGYLLLSDSYYPGWIATIDGKPCRIQRADFDCRAVKIPAGHHTVIFEFRPQSYILGKWITAASVLVLIVIFGFSGFQRRDPHA